MDTSPSAVYIYLLLIINYGVNGEAYEIRMKLESDAEVMFLCLPLGGEETP